MVDTDEDGANYHMNDGVMISIIVPVYNVEKFLPDCIESILKQTYPYLQIILIDDGSPDRCPLICDHYAKLDSRLQVIHQQNAGIAVTRNVGLHAVGGKYVLFVDSDDILMPQACEKLVERAERVQADIVDAASATRYEKQETGLEEKRVENKILPEAGPLAGERYVQNQMDKGSFLFNLWARLYRRDFLQACGSYFSPGIVCEDVEWSLAVFFQAKTVVQCEDIVYVYRVRQGSIMHADDQGRIRRTKDFMHEVVPAVIDLIKPQDRQFKHKLMHRLLSECLTNLACTADYFSCHRKEVSINSFFPVVEKKYWLWLFLLTIDLRVFRFFWHLRGRL